jgi:two-component sensor histidine kinase
MASQKVQDLCEVAAAVGDDEVDLLAMAAARLDLLADLATADLTLFASTREPGNLVVLAEGRPTVCRTLYRKPRTGEIIAAQADPLVGRCLRSGRSQRSRYVCLLGGRPAEQVALPVYSRARRTVAALSIERALLNGRWAPRRRPLREAAGALSRSLLQSAVRPRDLLSLIRMARNVAVTEHSGDILYADEASRQLWRRTQPEDRHLVRLPPGPPAETTVLSHREELWGSEWEFEAAGVVLRRRDLLFDPGAEGSNRLTTLHDVSHLHAGEWLVSSRSAAVQEIHHRIKNNLQTISSLLRMQSRRESSPQARESLHTAIGRVQSVAFVHEALSRDGADEVDLKALASDLVEAALHGSQRDDAGITHAVLGPRLLLPAAKATQVALALNELIQNAVKHAFPAGRQGSLTVRFDRSPEAITVAVHDDGVGLPQDFDVSRAQTLGLQITKTIVESDLGGSLSVVCDGGTHVAISLPPTFAHQEAESR